MSFALALTQGPHTERPDVRWRQADLRCSVGRRLFDEYPGAPWNGFELRLVWRRAGYLRPPVPVVTLTATPASVASGQTTSLQWSASDATSCTASGGWSGAKSASGGTETTSAVTAPTTYTLTCTGPGGSVNKSVSVSISAPSGGGGGGTIDAALLGLALLMLLVRAVPSLQHRREKPSTLTDGSDQPRILSLRYSRIAGHEQQYAPEPALPPVKPRYARDRVPPRAGCA